MTNLAALIHVYLTALFLTVINFLRYIGKIEPQ